jgi:hypothetical protein
MLESKKILLLMKSLKVQLIVQLKYKIYQEGHISNKN